MELKNKLIKSLTLKADGLDFQGNAVGDGSIVVSGLSQLSQLRAMEIYDQIQKLAQDLRDEVSEAERQNKIAYHEEELNKLKTEEVK